MYSESSRVKREFILSTNSRPCFYPDADGISAPVTDGVNNVTASLASSRLLQGGSSSLAHLAAGCMPEFDPSFEQGDHSLDTPRLAIV